MFIKREGSFGTGCWNAFLHMLLALLAIGAVIGISVGIVSEPEPKETAQRVEIVHPVTGERVEECLVLFRGENDEPDYRLGRDEECEEQ